MLEYPIVIYEPKCWTVYLHTVPKEIRSSFGKMDYYDKYYVGITKRNIEDRWGSNGYEYRNQIFGNAIQKYGWDNIKHEILISGLYRKIACMMEIYFIDKYKSFIKDGHGYNATKGGEGFLGVRRFGKENYFYGKHHTEETREKMRKNHRDISGEKNNFYGKHHTEETKRLISEINKKRYMENPESFKGNYTMSEERKREVGIRHSKPVYVFDMKLNFIGEYSSIISAADALKITRRVAETIVNQVRKSDYDYIIKFKEEVPDIELFQKTYRIRTYKPIIHNSKDVKNVDNPIYQFDKNYNYLGEFKNKYQASEKTCIDVKKIDSCCFNGRKYVDDFVFVFKKNVPDIDKYIRIKRRIKNKKSNSVSQYDLYGNLLNEYESINDAKNQTGFSYYSIYHNCENNTQSSNGYIWRYSEVNYE